MCFFFIVKGIDKVVVKGILKLFFDVYVSMMIFLKIFGIMFEIVLVEVFYLRLFDLYGVVLLMIYGRQKKVGISWVGKLIYVNDFKRFCFLSYFFEFMGFFRFAFYSL